MTAEKLPAFPDSPLRNRRQLLSARHPYETRSRDAESLPQPGTGV